MTVEDQFDARHKERQREKDGGYAAVHFVSLGKGGISSAFGCSEMTLRLVRMATKVDPTWLVEIAPQLVKIETGLSPAYDPNQDVCVSTARTNFNGQVVKEDRVQTPEHDAASQELAKWIAGQMV